MEKIKKNYQNIIILGNNLYLCIQITSGCICYHAKVSLQPTNNY